MNVRPLGATGLPVSEIGFGCSRLGGVFAGAGDRSEALAVLESALDSGITFYDTADMYSQGESEALLGRAFRSKRDRVAIATKGGYCLPAQRRLAGRLKPLLRPALRALGLKRRSLPAAFAGAPTQDFTPGYLARAVEGSLRRLRTDYLDVYLLHSPPGAFLAGDRALAAIDALQALRKQGKIRHYGVAVDTAADAALALCRCPGIGVIELPFGLMDRDALCEALFGAAARGVGVIARGCYAAGLLRDDLTEAELRERTDRWQEALSCRRAAADLGRSMLEAALHFCLATPEVSVTLVGMRTQDHLAANLRFLSAPRLTVAEYRKLAEGAAIPAPGELEMGREALYTDATTIAAAAPDIVR